MGQNQRLSQMQEHSSVDEWLLRGIALPTCVYAADADGKQTSGHDIHSIAAGMVGNVQQASACKTDQPGLHSTHQQSKQCSVALIMLPLSTKHVAAVLACILARVPFFRVASSTTDKLLLAHFNALQPVLVLCDALSRARLQSLGLLPGWRPLALGLTNDVVSGGTNSAECWAKTPQDHQAGYGDVSASGGPTQALKYTPPVMPSGASLSLSPGSQTRHLCLVATSGSAGEPKYVLLSHKSFLHRMRWQEAKFPLPSDAVVMIKSSPAFVDSLWEVLAPMCFGRAPSYWLSPQHL
eukprot:jgi/Ulvmu1/10000/UM059_0049.1